MGNGKKQASLFDEYTIAKEGEEAETTITVIRVGTLGEFKSEKYFEKIEDAEGARTQKAIQVECANGAKQEFALPRQGKTISPVSALGRFNRTYNELPSEGLTIKTKIDANGYPQIILYA